MSKKILVTYFSATGTTAKVAKIIADAANADLFEIKPEIPYSKADLDWMDKKSRSSIEMQDQNSRPKLALRCSNMQEYDVIFVGFPIWWYVAPKIINTFLECYDFSGKTIIPFATSGSSDVGDTDKFLHSSCSKETLWKPAKRFPSNLDEATARKWLKNLNL